MYSSFKYSRKYRKIIFNLINAPSLNVAFNLCFLKKIRSLYEEVLLSRLSSIEFEEKY